MQTFLIFDVKLVTELAHVLVKSFHFDNKSVVHLTNLKTLQFQFDNLFI